MAAVRPGRRMSNMHGGAVMVARHSRAEVIARLKAEARRLHVLRTGAMPPDAASPEIVAAPARGPQVVVPQYESVQTPSGPRTRRATQDGYHPVRRADAFDVMAFNHRKAAKDAPPLFTVGQVEAGRAYAALHERVRSEGAKASTLEPRFGTGGTRDYIDNVILRSDKLRAMQAAIGDGLVAGIERQSIRGVSRSAILRGEYDEPPVYTETLTVRALVDAVCLAELTVTQFLRASWPPVTQPRRKIVLAALIDALESVRDAV